MTFCTKQRAKTTYNLAFLCSAQKMNKGQEYQKYFKKRVLVCVTSGLTLNFLYQDMKSKLQF